VANSSPSPASGASPSPSASAATGVAIKDAADARDKLVAAMKIGTQVPSDGEMTDTWSAVLPGVKFSGYGIEATTKSVSGFAFVYSKTKRVEFLAFTVLDTGGNCEGGVLEAGSDGEKITQTVKMTVPTGTKCSGSALSDLRGY
jgi:hypothetical protein